MNAFHNLRCFFIIIYLLLGPITFAQLSKTHYIPPLTESGDNSSAPQDHYIYISTPSAITVSFTIKPIGLSPASYITGTVSRTAPYIHTIGNGRNTQLFVNVNETSTVKTNKGYIIEAESPIYVSVRINAGAQAGALVSKGASALGTNFRVGSYTNANPQSNYLNFVSVMATEDNTQISFSNLPAGLIIENYTGATPVPVNLNKGQTYIVATNSFKSVTNRDGLIGCLVSSTKPIVVNCGSANGSFGTGTGRDYGIDQIVDVSKVGPEYIFVRGDGDNAWENILIVAHSNNTSISINGNAPVTTINAGQYYLIEGNNYNANGNMYVKTSEDVFAYQGVGASSSEANQGMFFVPPLSCETRGNLDNIADITNIGSTVYTGGITIVTKVGATVTINNAPISSFSTIGPSTVTGNPNYVTYKVLNLTGNISVQSSDELYCAYFNQNNNATSGSFYSGFPSAPEIIFDAQFVTLGNCIPNIKLQAANTQSFDSFKWLFDDGSGSGFVDLMISNTEITPLIPGKYKLIGVIACTGEELESVEVPVSICPDDIDNDGIIDNIDIDNDNDGVLNCTESKGDVTIDIANIAVPQLHFQDGSINSSIVSGNFTQTSSSGGTNFYTGNNQGNFTSIVSAANDAEGNYSLTFTETVNLKFSEDIASLHNATSGEYFIARILPVNKNITLVDPDNRLLVDSNFDGIFETGITMISGSEIHFKINPTPNGNRPYEFFANGVNGFSFVHKLNNTTASSTFKGIISLTCFKKDTDGDGIKDELDLDSDNDGIPDFVEAYGSLMSLSNVDTDLNGLDDIYDINHIPLDSDGDGVYDFYDLDSDNDGIYDVFESGSNLPDTNLDGVIDNVISTMGSNGWDDNAETSPDSNLIGYPINDLDTDGILSYIDLDSDGDGCSDVIEAGFSDGNNDDLLGDNTVTVDGSGLVNNASDGYTLPNPDYLTTAIITIITQPVDTEVCELSNAVISVIGSNIDTVQWELSTDGINWINIIDDSTYNGSQTDALTILSTPLTFNSYKFRAFLNVAGNACGLYTDEVTLTVIQLPVANIAPNMQQCDDDNNGTMPFDLILQNNAINTTPGMTITYHASQSDADTGNAPITSPYESGNATIYARVTNDLNGNCFDTSTFNLEVYETPVPLFAPNITPIQECDNTSVGTDIDGFIVFDLTQRETEIRNGQSATDFTLTYFTDSGYSSQIMNPSAFPNTIASGQTIYVRMTNNNYSACFTDTAFNIEIFTLPVVNNPSKYSQCDDASNDGQAYFNLELDIIKEEINPNYLAEGLTFKFYENQSDAILNGIAIANPSNYQDALGFALETIWIRVENPNGCFRVVPLILEVTPSSVALSSYNPNSIYQCDDGTDLRDGIATFDLTPIQDYIKNVIFSSVNNISVDFYESQLDAELETNAITDPANHQNTNYPNTQDIWVRIKSDLGNKCLGLERFPNLLIVEALPIAYPVTMARQCDYDTSDAVLSFPFDTSQIETNLLNRQNPANVTITYFDALGNALPSPLPNPFITESQIITVRITNNNTQDPDGACFDETTIEFIVDAQPVANPVPDFVVCDGDAGDSDNDGLYPFDTSNIESTVLGIQTGMETYYTFSDEFGNSITAQTLPNPFNSGNQTVMVEVINPINMSCTATTSINFIVNPLPDFEIDTPQIVCSSDPTFTVLLDPIEADPSEVFNYSWILNGSEIATSSTLTVSTPGTYTVTLTKTDGTGCFRSRDVYVDASEMATITMDDVNIVDISENNSITINETNLGLGDYEYALDDELGPYQDDPFFNQVKAGFHTIYIRDKKGCGIASLEVSVIGYQKFFTPNNDGYNEFWQIKGVNAQFYPNTNITIFDRYGKLLKQLNPLSEGWDGTFNGAMLPSDDYWFKVILEDGRSFMGHFTLKR